jgi:hypothetical protein
MGQYRSFYSRISGWRLTASSGRSAMSIAFEISLQASSKTPNEDPLLGFVGHQDDVT